MQVVEAAPRVRPARRFANAAAVVEMTKPGVGVRLQNAAEGGQVLARTLATALRRVAEEYRRRLTAAGRTIVAHVGPEAARLGAAAARIEHRHRGVIGVELARRRHVARERCDERIDEMEAAGDPFGERRSLDPHAFASVDLTLTIQRQVVAVLRDQHVREQPRAAEPTRDRT